ncbi:RipA family octameric membrane protein [Myroides odoratimimus]|uniref:RipA family octameric membrane protein n=1 Tax=Myroides odoratimimus TaxID=76832 RepID=UPI00091B56ED|nr:TIR domain-containing protein [Myroides odoratimimus]SHM20280.1 TIR domain-containing protein [Myroides odoratimimus subsp. xuanwuensis]
MKLFICSRNTEKEGTKKVISDLLDISKNSIAILHQFEENNNWQKEVEQKFRDSDFIVFLIGEETFKSKQVLWEYAKAKELNKQIVGIKLESSSEESVLFCQGFQVFNDVKESYEFLSDTYKANRALRIEQYKIMVSSTEKVTDSRLKVNNLFFTITSTILSVSFVLMKTYSFSLISIIATIILTLLAFITTFFWEKLIRSYGLLNTGKFRLVNQIEKELRTNMFEEEWRILTNEIKYISNTKTETNVVISFRYIILILLIVEVCYLFYTISTFCTITSLISQFVGSLYKIVC